MLVVFCYLEEFDLCSKNYLTQKNRTDLHLFSKPIQFSMNGKLKRHSTKGKTLKKYI